MYIDLTEKSGGVIVMVAFGAHFLKEISRTQMLSAAKRLLPHQKKTLNSLEKNEFLIPLGKAFVEHSIIAIRKGALVKDLSCNDVEKVGTF